MEYETFLLATALIERDRWHAKGPTFPLHPEREAAAELALLKARSLFEFLTGKRNKGNQLTLVHFGLSHKSLWGGSVYGKLSQLATHLTLDRASAEPEAWPERFGIAEEVLREAVASCRDIQASGVKLSVRHHKARHPMVVRQLAELGIPYE